MTIHLLHEPLATSARGAQGDRLGIAKATEGRFTDNTVYTQLHQFIGTPAYMSPEQAEMSGLDVTPAATSTAWACCSTNCWSGVGDRLYS